MKQSYKYLGTKTYAFTNLMQAGHFYFRRDQVFSSSRCVDDVKPVVYENLTLID